MSRQDVERAGLRYPPGDPEDFTTASRQLGRVSADLQAVPGRIQRLGQLGAAWTGAAAERFRAGTAWSVSSISDVSAALRLASLAADMAGEALRRQQRTARRLAEQVNEAEEDYRRADREAERAEEHAEQARDQAAQATLGTGGFALAEQVRATRAAEAATQEAAQARRRADRGRERYQELRQRSKRELRQLEEDTERADARARSMLDETGHALATVADPSAEPGCPIDTPLFSTGAGLLPFLTHGRQIARDALTNPFDTLAGSARKNAYSALAEGLREAFPGTCIGPEPPTPPSDPPSPRPEPARPVPEPADEPSWFERRWDDVKHFPGEVKQVAEDVPGAVSDAAGAVEDGYHAVDRWTDDRQDDVGDWLQDNLPDPSDESSGPGLPLPLPRGFPPLRAP